MTSRCKSASIAYICDMMHSAKSILYFLVEQNRGCGCVSMVCVCERERAKKRQNMSKRY